jgi:Cft2 family RNA processing exonuclease
MQRESVMSAASNPVVIPSGPKEEAVFRAVLLLLNELSSTTLQQVRLYIDEKERQKR